jgi:MFS transporter, DHA1 family, multidrug resistance protein
MNAYDSKGRDPSPVTNFSLPVPGPGKPNGLGFGEFIALMALMVSLVALSLDIMLPALPDIGRDLGVSNPNDVQLVISVLILGLSLGQVMYGPLSDSTGRKPMIFAGTVIFLIGCLLSINATRFTVMLAGRFLQGIGAAGPRSVIVALVRDRYEGRAMARVMSAVMAVFIIVPAVAPALGQAVLLLASWRAIFGALMALASLSLIWFMIRQPETLPRERRIAFSIKRIGRGVVEVCANRVAFGYTLTAGLVMGAFFGYLNCVQQIFQEVYGLGRLFPLFTAILALAIGSASFCNSRIVMRWGMRALSRRAIRLLILLSAGYFVIAYWMGGHSPLWALMVCLALVFFCVGILFGNLNAIAMQPLGHIAGVGAAVVGSLSSLIAVPPAIVIGRCYDGTTLPLISGFALLGLLSAGVMWWADRRRK